MLRFRMLAEPRERNDRIVAVATHARIHDGVTSLGDLPRKLIDEITSFFVNYNKLHGKRFKPLGLGKGDAAMKMIKTGRAEFKSSGGFSHFRR